MLKNGTLVKFVVEFANLFLACPIIKVLIFVEQTKTFYRFYIFILIGQDNCMIRNSFVFTDQCHITKVILSRKFLPKLLAFFFRDHLVHRVKCIDR